MKFDELNEDNYILFAIKYYDNPQAVTQDDFFEDLNRFKYIKKLLRRYVKSGELKTTLLINHFIIVFNIFNDAALPLLFFKIEKELWSSMKTFLVYLNRIPEYPKSFLNDIPIDKNCLKILESLYQNFPHDYKIVLECDLPLNKKYLSSVSKFFSFPIFDKKNQKKYWIRK